MDQQKSQDQQTPQSNPAVNPFAPIWSIVTLFSKQLLTLIIKAAVYGAIVFYAWNAYIAADFKFNLISYQSSFIISFAVLYLTNYPLGLLEVIARRLDSINFLMSYVRTNTYYTAIGVERLDKTPEVCNNSDNS